MAGNSVTSNVVIRINDRDVTNSFTGISKEVRKLQRELDGTTRGTEEFKRKAKELEEAKKKLAEVTAETGRLRNSLEESAGILGKFKTIFAGNVAADFFTGAVSKITEFGKELIKTVEELNNIKGSLSTLDNSLKGAALEKAASSVKAIADTYGKGAEEIQVAVKALNSQTKDTNKSLDLIKKGFMAGADASGEMLTQMKEYPTMMNDARISAEEMIAIMSESEKLGVYDDKGIDALKEGMLRIREGTKSAQDAMRALGIDVEGTYAKIKAGSMTYFDVIKLVSTKIKETGADSRITGTAIADIFGGPGEDAGYRYISQLSKINTNLSELTANADATVIAKNKEVEANEKLNSVWIKLTGTASFLSNAYSSAKSGMADMLSYVFRIKEAKVSDEFLQQEIRLRYLKSQLDNTNSSEEKKLEIFQALKTEFPQYFKGLDLEKMKHEEITKAINKSIDALGRKYRAQVFQEKFDETALDYQEKLSTALEFEKKGRDLIGEAFKKYPELSNLKFKSSTTVNQLRELDAELQKIFDKERGDGTVFDAKSWQSLDTNLQRSIHSTASALANANKAAVKSDMQRIADQKSLAEIQSKLIPDTFATEDPNAPGANKDADMSGTLAAAAKAAEAARKKAEEARKKALEEQRKDLEESIKNEADANNRSLEAEIQYRLDKLKIIEDSYGKEVLLANLERSKELNEQRKKQDEILKNIANNENKSSEAKSPEAKSNYENALKKERSLLQTHDQIIITSEDTHRKKLATIREKWDTVEFEKAFTRENALIEKQRQRDDEEIISIDSLTKAKALLKDNEYLKLTNQELAAITNLEDAKSALREAADRKMLAAQLVSLEIAKKQLEDHIASMSNGPAKEELLKNLDELSLKITQVKGAITDGKEQDDKKVQEETDDAKSKVDILGFSAKDWEDAYGNLDTTAGKIKMVGMAVQALSNAFQQYAQLQQNLNEREMRTFDKNQNKKKKDLLKQLNEGLINQEEYHKQLELLEVQKANKEAEITYKSAKMQKAIQIASAIASTALAVATALTAGPIAGPILAAIVGALGAVQIGIIASQPLPERPSFDVGGHTGSGFGSPDASGFKPAGIVHESEWVAPKWMLEEPRTAKVIDYLESVRSGKTKPMADGGFSSDNTISNSPTSNNTSSQNSDSMNYFISVMAEVKNLLQKLYDDGVVAEMVDSEQNGKLFKKAIKKFETITDRASQK